MAKQALHVRMTYAWLDKEGAKLTPLQFKCYAMMLRFTRESGLMWTGQTKLGKLVGVSPREIRKLIGQLEDKHLVRIEYRPGRTNEYYVHRSFEHSGTAVPGGS